MRHNLRMRLVAAFAGACAAMLSGTAASAASAPAADPVVQLAADPVVQGDASVSFGRLILEPTDRGYLGTLPITVGNKGTDDGFFQLRFREPVAGSFDRTSPEQFCQTETAILGHRETYGCFLDRIEPGGTLTFGITFRVLTKTKPYAMEATGGQLAIADDYVLDAPFSAYASFRALFRSTTGSLRAPRPYRQDLRADASLALAGDVTMVREADGWYRGRVQATVGYGTDAAHDFVLIDTVVPDDRVILVGTEPADVPCWRSCEAPGGRFMEGEERAVELIFEAPADATPGTVEATGTVAAYWRGEPVAETDTSDNAVTFQVRIPEAA